MVNDVTCKYVVHIVLIMAVGIFCKKLILLKLAGIS